MNFLNEVHFIWNFIREVHCKPLIQRKNEVPEDMNQISSQTKNNETPTTLMQAPTTSLNVTF